MRSEVLNELSEGQLKDYASLIGVKAGKGKSLVRAIEEARAHVARVDLLGMDFEVPIKRMHDKRITDVLGQKSITDEQAEEVMLAILGDEQYQALIGRCTDDDGTVDTDALAVALSALITSDELKNF